MLCFLLWDSKISRHKNVPILRSKFGSPKKVCHFNVVLVIATWYIIVPLPFWHKLNYFLFWWTFEYLSIMYAKILINLKVQLWGFELQTFQQWFKTGAEVKMSNLNNYSTVCCQNGIGTMVCFLSLKWNVLQSMLWARVNSTHHHYDSVVDEPQLR